MRVKLIRDRIKIAPGPNWEVRTINTVVGKQLALIAKLHEEVAEIANDAWEPGQDAEFLEAMLELARINGVRWEQIEEAMRHKRATHGGFRMGRVWIVQGHES